MSDPTPPPASPPRDAARVDEPFTAAIRYLVELGRKRLAKQQDAKDDEAN